MPSDTQIHIYDFRDDYYQNGIFIVSKRSGDFDPQAIGKNMDDNLTDKLLS